MKRTTEDERAIKFARDHLDLSKNLNDQGYYGPLPNEADPRPYTNMNRSEADARYFEWMEGWIAGNGGGFDNERMSNDRLAFIHRVYPASRRYDPVGQLFFRPSPGEGDSKGETGTDGNYANVPYIAYEIS